MVGSSQNKPTHKHTHTIVEMQIMGTPKALHITQVLILHKPHSSEGTGDRRSIEQLRSKIQQVIPEPTIYALSDFPLMRKCLEKPNK